MGKIVRGLAVFALVAGALLTATPAADALTTTTLTNYQQPGHAYIVIDHVVRFEGFVSPKRPDGSPFKLQRYYGGAWHTIATKGLYRSQWYIERKLTTYGWQRYRICVPATRTATAACTKSLRFLVGRYHYFVDLTPVSASPGFSTGSLTVEGFTHSHAIRFGVQGGDFVVYNLHGTCDATSGYIGIDDDANDVNTGTFNFYRDGTFVASRETPLGGFLYKSASTWGWHQLKITATTTGYPDRTGRLGIATAGAFCAW